MIAKTKQFTNEVKTELQKATWPWDPNEKGFKKYKELVDSTILVLVGMLLLGGFVAFWDLILSFVVKAVTGA
ncbi:MAG: preprotein translocase subunit SecE [Verrucomicrobia bacterium]|nr:preprotein translocase subunit SecE [Verrucomicrobiota bacterium]